MVRQFRNAKSKLSFHGPVKGNGVEPLQQGTFHVEITEAQPLAAALSNLSDYSLLLSVKAYPI
jgi:hypothetical protein